MTTHMDGRSDRLDPMMPVQLYMRRASTPERRLMAAVLEDALHVALAPEPRNRRARRLRDMTDEWLFSDDESWPFSFVNACHALDLDPAWMRERVLARRCHAAVPHAA